MPVRRVKGGYQWGRHGKVYRSKAAAERQAAAAFANGYRGDAARRSAAFTLQASRTAEKRYERELKGLVRSYVRAYSSTVGRQDAHEKEIADIDHVQMLVQTEIPSIVGRSFDRMAAAVRSANKKSLSRISPTDTRIAAHVASKRDENIRLIENAHREYAAAVRKIIGDPENFGKRVEDIRQQILDEGGVSESRAALIARDQTLKLNGQINEIRQTNAGIDSYVWSTSKDERVRPSHQELDGEEFQWASPPVVDGEAVHPGQAIQCRCVAIPVTG